MNAALELTHKMKGLREFPVSKHNVFAAPGFPCVPLSDIPDGADFQKAVVRGNLTIAEKEVFTKVGKGNYLDGIKIRDSKGVVREQGGSQMVLHRVLPEHVLDEAIDE